MAYWDFDSFLYSLKNDYYEDWPPEPDNFPDEFDEFIDIKDDFEEIKKLRPELSKKPILNSSTKK